MTLFLELLALAGLILLNAFFVAAEYGLVTSRRTRIRELGREGNRRGGNAVWRYYVQLLDHQGILPQELVPNV